MGLCDLLCLSVFVWPSCVAKSFALKVLHILFNHDLFTPTVLTGTVECCHRIPLSVALNLSESYKISGK